LLSVEITEPESNPKQQLLLPKYEDKPFPPIAVLPEVVETEYPLENRVVPAEGENGLAGAL